MSVERLEENNVKNENERKKEYLRGYRTNRRRVNRIDGEVTELRELAKSVKATDYSGMPHGSGNQKDLSDELARIELLEKKKKSVLNRILLLKSRSSRYRMRMRMMYYFTGM